MQFRQMTLTTIVKQTITSHKGIYTLSDKTTQMYFRQKRVLCSSTSIVHGVPQYFQVCVLVVILTVVVLAIIIIMALSPKIIMILTCTSCQLPSCLQPQMMIIIVK